jgi:hypothetical protein
MFEPGFEEKGKFRPKGQQFKTIILSWHKNL